MSLQQEHPLVSVALMTYNQERYVKESLLSILNQTYDNLEIIISDDGSNDNTWEIIEHEVDLYRHSGGRFCNIVLNRNVVNLGVAKHFELILSKCHGKLIVCQAGDDVSLPERILVIVDALKNNPGATVFSHDAMGIDEEGKIVADVVKTSVLMPLGAMMAYSRRVYDEFEPISEDGAWEDDVYARRAQMIGDEVQIGKILMKYRIGCGGICSGSDDLRVKRSRVAKGCLASARQSRKDLEYCKDSIGTDRYSKVLKIIDWYERRYSDEYNMYNARFWLQRVYAFHRLHKELNCKPYLRQFAGKMMPSWVLSLIRPWFRMSRRVLSQWR